MFSNQQQELGESIINYTARSDKRQEKGRDMQKKNVKKTTKADTTTSSKSDYEYLQETARHILRWAKKLRSGRIQVSVFIKIGDIDAHVEPDSGASVNMTDEY